MNNASLKYIATLLLFLFFAQYTATAQSRFSLGVATALDFVTTSNIPRYQSLGYGNQFQFRYGVRAMARLNKRLSIGIALDAYNRSENYDCVHFPDPEDPPRSSYHIFINNPNYECQFKSEATISFLEIPLLVQYDLVQREDLSIFVEAGVGYHMSHHRKTKLTDLQTNAVSEEQDKSFFTWSRYTPRLSVGVAKNLSPKLTLAGTLLYKADNYSFNYSTWGLGTILYYHL
ncbi:MAG: outer membrane beta-barrel protein [Phaeodactylibacter sp.]|uniref:outer membrane beta-barrel protein n=1 Tax=Phaeodactylibacter sp. TaxID=1940289 RepID=UPI0032EF705F